MSVASDLLTVETVTPYLRARGLLDDTPVTVRELGGGVSNVVIAVNGPSPMVVKQSLPQLRVASPWSAPQDRTVTEAEALALCSDLTPGRVPRLLDVDPDRYVICVEHAPTGWEDWKASLMSGAMRAGTAKILGHTLATWHSVTAAGNGITPRMSDPRAFELLRIDPYFHNVALREPGVATDMAAVVDELHARRRCLVHGDFSPKNVLIGPATEDLLVIDFEVAHVGDPAFDVAFLLSHLVLKSIHLPALANRLDHAAHEFVKEYDAKVRDDLRPEMTNVLRYIGALLLARVQGKSPAEYLDNSERKHAWSLGMSLLRNTATAVDSIPGMRRKTAP